MAARLELDLSISWGEDAGDQVLPRLRSGQERLPALPQGETLVSAYLRTLAYAMHTGRLRTDQAEYHAMLALPMNRGLAALEPVERPAWSRNLRQRWQDAGRTLIGDLWAQAGKCLRPGEIPAALWLAEADEKDFIEIEVDLVVGHGAFDAAEPAAEPRSTRGTTPKPGAWRETYSSAMARWRP